MLVKFFRHGNTNQNPQGGRSGGGNSVRDYLLGKNNDREFATLLRGNADNTTEIINGIKNKSKYTSGVLSFSKDEIVSDIEKQKIISDFENILFPNMTADQYSGYWVQHEDKDRLELHFVFANIELQSEKSLPVYYARNDQHLIDSWKEVINLEYAGLISPNDPSRKRDFSTTQEFEKGKKSTDDLLKQDIHNRLLDEIQSNPTIKTRDDIVKTLQGMGHEITRTSKKDNSISIKNPSGGRNLKLKGALYAPDFDRDYSIQQAIDEYNFTENSRLFEQKIKYLDNLEKRANRLNTRFGNLDRTPPDNELTADLSQIRAENEPAFLAEIETQQREIKYTNAKETLAQYDNASLYPDDIDHFVTLEQSQLLERQQQQQQIISDIEYKIASGDELTPHDELDYRHAKAFTNSLDDILEAQRLAQEQAEQEFKQNIQTQLEFMLDTVGEILPPDTYSKWQALTDSDLATYLEDYQRRGQALLDKAQSNILTADELTNDKTIKNVIATIQDITASREAERIAQAQQARLEAERLEQARLQAEQIKDQLTSLEAITGQATQDIYDSLLDYEPTQLEKMKELHTQLTEKLLNKAGHEVIPHFNDELDRFIQSSDIIATIDYITAERIAQEQEQARLEAQRIEQEQAQAQLEAEQVKAQEQQKQTTPAEPVAKPALPVNPDNRRQVIEQRAIEYAKETMLKAINEIPDPTAKQREINKLVEHMQSLSQQTITDLVKQYEQHQPEKIKELQIWTSRVTLYEYKDKIEKDPDFVDTALGIAKDKMYYNEYHDPSDPAYAPLKAEINNFAETVRAMREQPSKFHAPAVTISKNNSGIDR